MASFWAFLFYYLSYVYGFLTRYICRYYNRHGNFYVEIVKEDDRTFSNSGTKFEVGDEFSRKDENLQEETEGFVHLEDVFAPVTNKYQFMSGSDVRGFMERPTTMSLNVQELFVPPQDFSVIKSPKVFEEDKQFVKINSETQAADQQKKGGGFGFLDEKDFFRLISEAEAVYQQKEERFNVFEDDKQLLRLTLDTQATDQSKESHYGFMEEAETIGPTAQEKFESLESISVSESPVVVEEDKQILKLSSGTTQADHEQKAGESEGEEELISSEDEHPEKEEVILLVNDSIKNLDHPGDVQLKNNFFDFELEPPSNFPSSDELLEKEELIAVVDDSTDSFDHAGDVQLENNFFALELGSPLIFPSDETLDDRDSNEVVVEASTSIARELKHETYMAASGEGTPEDEYIIFEPHEETFSRQNSGNAEDDELEFTGIDEEEVECVDDDWEDESSSDSDDDLFEQMNREIKLAKTGGLPTISEESDPPEMTEYLDPMKLEKKIEHKDLMEEIHMFYKSYAQKMRKLDILNRQTMHAVGLLRLKDPTQLISRKKSSSSALTSIIARSIRHSKVGNLDPTEKYVRDLQRDFELIYIGQVCLSWEILVWQHGKSRALQDYDPHGFRQYNLAANEFQQFQVVLQRFIENDRFQGPRIQHYVEKRCALGTLLQVPSIRDDSSKDKKIRKEVEEYVISVGSVPDIVWESMRIFWEFLRGDKDDNLISSHTDLHDTADPELMMEIKTSLQKKDKRLKELVRSQGCIAKRLQRHRENRLDCALFLAQVEIKLVSRVLCMSKLTRDQLRWCRAKLDEINFVSRRVSIEHTFLLFPC